MWQAAHNPPDGTAPALHLGAPGCEPKQNSTATCCSLMQENMACGCLPPHLPTISECEAAAALTGLHADVLQLSDGFQTLVSWHLRSPTAWLTAPSA